MFTKSFFLAIDDNITAKMSFQKINYKNYSIRNSSYTFEIM